LHDQLYPLVLEVDNVYPENILDDLRERGHNVSGTVLVLITSRCVLNHVVFHSSRRQSRRRRSARRPAGRQALLFMASDSLMSHCNRSNDQSLAASDSRKNGITADH
jgi:hypothetical protein